MVGQATTILVMEDNEHKPGYKRTKLGWIPEDWEVKPINKLATTTAGGTPNTKNNEYWNGEIPWMSSGDLNLKIIYEVKGRITKKGLKKSSAKLIPKNSVLVGLAGQGKTRGTAAVNKIKLTTNQSVAAIIPDDDKIYYKYLYYNVDRRYDELRQLSTGAGGRGGLNLKIINSFKIPYPKISEQKKIAEVITCWDVAIKKQNLLVRQKQLQKKGLMQQLLTGKKRLPGFSGEWQECKIEEIADEVVLKNDQNKNILVFSCTKYNGLVPSLKYFGRKVYSDDTSSYKLVPQHHFAYATNHIEEGSIGYQSQYEDGLVSPMYTVFKSKKPINDNFLYRLLKSYKLIHEYNKHMEGSINRRGGLRWNQFSKIKIFLPPPEEQDAINQVLYIVDQEIQLLKKKKEMLQNQKKGLMQQLLTGKKRIPSYEQN